METKENKIDDIPLNKYGQPILSSRQLHQLVLQGKNIGHLGVIEDNDIRLFNKYQSELLTETVVFLPPEDNEELTIDEFHFKCASEWLFPKVYQTIDVKQWLLNKCKSAAEIERVNTEYKIYLEKDLIMLLRLFIYLVDYMRENGFVWGIGRGSSVSSYILYLIGIHKVDSLKYNLAISDYLK